MHALVAGVVVSLFAQVSPGAGPGRGGLGPPRMTTELTMAEPKVTHPEGKVDRAIVKRYLRRDQNKYRYCYEKALVVDPTLRGTLSIQFRVLPDGSLTSVRVEGIANDVENCVAAFVRRLQLPKILEGAEVRTKVMLKPVKPAPLPHGYGCGGVGCGRLGG